MNDKELKELAVRFAKEFWNRDLKIGVCFKELRKGRYGQYEYWYKRDRRGKVSGYTPKGISISPSLKNKRTQLELVLKHELAHWYCQTSGKSFSDGSRDFEAELLRIGATSTGHDLNDFEGAVASSKQIQKEFVEGKRNLKGSKSFTYEEVEPSKDGYEKEYKVFYDGTYLGNIGKWKWGKYRWNPITDYHEYNRLSWTARKHAVEDMLKKYKEKHS